MADTIATLEALVDVHGPRAVVLAMANIASVRSKNEPLKDGTGYYSILSRRLVRLVRDMRR